MVSVAPAFNGGSEMTVRAPAVAGLFYPAEPQVLAATVRACLESARGAQAATPAVIAPHAGYLYSGPVAGSAYAPFAALRGRIERVLLLGPAHRVALRGLAAPAVDAFATPLGQMRVDRAAVAELAALPFVAVDDRAHAQEHGLEVQLPFLHEVLGDVAIVPLVVGAASAEEVARVIRRALAWPHTLIVISSDLSHYHPYQEARVRDRRTAAAIERLEPQAIDHDDACGATPIRGLLMVAREQAWQARCTDLRNSGDTAGPKERVVGYGAFGVGP